MSGSMYGETVIHAKRGVVGHRQPPLHRQLLGAREFEALSAEDQAALAALPKAVRRDLQDFWDPAGAEFGLHELTLDGTAVFDLERAFRGFGVWSDLNRDGDEGDYHWFPGVDASVVVGTISDDEGLSFQCSRERETRLVMIEGFTRAGDIAGDEITVTVLRGDGESFTVPASEFDAAALARRVSQELGGNG